MDKDGFADVIVGAPFNDAGGIDAGRAYIYSGRDGHLLWTFTGILVNLNFGHSVSGAGDVDGDGFADVIVGEFPEPPLSTSTSGHAYVFSGATGSLIWSFSGDAAGDHFGSTVSGAGDVDNDGYTDLIVGAEHLDAGGWGRAYVYSGRTGAVMWTLNGEQIFDRFGQSVSGAGDVDGDGFADAIVGARWNSVMGDRTGRAYVYSGRTGGLLHTFTGEVGDYLGCSVSGAGDVNGDGFGDLVVGAYRGGYDVGRVYLYSGDTGTLLWSAVGDGTGDHFGLYVAGVGDVNGDGHGDIAASVIGVPRIYSGISGALLWQMPDPSAQFNFELSSAGDVNGDGTGDIIVGAKNYDSTGNWNGPGRAYVYSLADADGDLIPDPCDNCPHFANPDQIGCPCHGEPVCDSVSNLQDVVATVNVAFRGGAPVVDPPCPHSPGGRTDLNCDGVATVVDVVRMVNVVFRGYDPATQICNPCACNPYPTTCP